MESDRARGCLPESGFTEGMFRHGFVHGVRRKTVLSARFVLAWWLTYNSSPPFPCPTTSLTLWDTVRS